MTIRKHQSDELDTLIEQSLIETVSDQQPRQYVWRRIKRFIDVPVAHHTPRWHWSLVVQIVVVTLVIFGSRSPLNWQRAFVPSIPPITPTAFLPQAITHVSTGVIVPLETQEFRVLKISAQHTTHVPTISPTPPLNLPPTDVLRLSAPEPSATQSMPQLAFVNFTMREGGEFK